MLLVKGICSTEVPHTVVDPDLQIRLARGGGGGGGGGGGKQTLRFLDQFGLKTRGGGGGGPPGRLP